MSLFVDYASIDGNSQPDTALATGFGIRGAIVRGSFSLAGVPHIDPHLERDGAAWRAAGAFGSYTILGWHGASPEEQAAKFIESYTKKPGDLPPALDLEADSNIAIGMKPEQALDWAHRAYAALSTHYGTVMVYTSARVWRDVFNGLPSPMGASPLWLKVPYPYKERQPPHPEAANPDGPEILPLPWSTPTSAGVWLKQFQGDAKGVPGFSSTVDLSVFCALNTWQQPSPQTKRMTWLAMQLAMHGESDVRAFQKARGLVADGVVGPVTFAALTDETSHQG